MATPSFASKRTGEALPSRAGSETIEAAGRAQRVLDATESACWEGSPRGGPVWCSPALLRRIAEAPAGELEWAQLVQSIHPDDRAGFEHACQTALRLAGRFSHDIRLKDTGGSYRWVRAVGSASPGGPEGAGFLTGAMLDVQAQKQAETELQEVNERFARVVQLAAMSYYERTEGDTVFHCHDGLSPIMDRQPVSGIDNIQNLLDSNHPDDRPRIDAERARCWAAPSTWDSEGRILHGDGGYRWTHRLGRSERLPDGRMRVTVVQRYIHDQKLAHMELETHRHHLQQLVEERTARLETALAEAKRQREEAERANEAKSVFLAHMSHEIRTPLNGVLGLNELALRDAQSERQRRYLSLALDSARSLLAVINDVLDLSRLNAETSPPKAEPFDLGQSLADTLRSMMPLLRDKDIAVRFDYVGSVSRVLGDPQRLHQIATNLIGNAVKFTEHGSLDVVANVQPDGPGRVVALIDFRDTGPGMAPEVAARVFEPFVQGDDRLARRHGGTGLGLSIARTLSRSLGGKLTLESFPGTGSTFTLHLPLAVAPGAQPVARKPPSGTAWWACADPLFGLCLERRLMRLGWRSQAIRSLPDLLRETSQARPPDLVLLDQTVLAETAPLRQLPSMLPHTRIVLLVRPDWSHRDIESVAQDAGMALLTKPLSPLELLDLLAPAAGDSAGQDVRDAGETAATVPPGLKVLVAEDNLVNQIIIAEMIEALGLHTRLAENGAIAVQACLQEPPSLVLMDLQMPGMDGLEATRQLRELQRAGTLPPFPIVGLTAHATPQDQAHAVEAGMVGYLTKPVGLDELRNELARWGPPGAGLGTK